MGELLIKSGVITEDQLKRALKLQEQSGLMLGEALIKAGFTTEEAITMAISKQIGVPYASRENGILKPEKGQGLESVVNEKFARDQLVRSRSTSGIGPPGLATTTRPGPLSAASCTCVGRTARSR